MPRLHSEKTSGARVVSMWIKTAAVLVAVIPLMGNKIVIEVPAGGAVVSSSGLVSCAAQETCTVDTSANPFTETLTAVAEPGYAFAGWEEGADALCAGSTSEDCTELADEAFSQFLPSANDETFAVRPTFTALDGEEPAVAPRFSVRSLHRTRFYEVRGETQEEIWDALHSAANPLNKNGGKHGGKNAVGYANMEVRYHYQAEYVEGGSDCRVASGELDFEFETTLPKLASSTERSEHFDQRWQIFHNDIVEHEAGHIALYRQLVTQLPEVMRRVPSVPCSELAEHVRSAVARSVDAITQANEEYDRSIGGGMDLADSHAY
jgi:predicted secreted Zn-dependent protease